MTTLPFFSVFVSHELLQATKKGKAHRNVKACSASSVNEKHKTTMSSDRSIDIDDNKSISKQSCFDWGLSRDTLISADGSLGVAGDRSSSDSASKGPSSRYDPKAMSRIVDITDLVDEGDSDDEEVIGHSSGLGGVTREKSGGPGRSYGPGGGGAIMFRQALILIALVGIIVAASLAIGFAVPSSSSKSVEGNEQALFETAERVVLACSESALNEDMKACQKICKKNMCCFETGKYSCKDNEKKMCAAYAGCEALVDGVLLGGAEENEE